MYDAIGVPFSKGKPFGPIPIGAGAKFGWMGLGIAGGKRNCPFAGIGCCFSMLEIAAVAIASITEK